MSRPLRYAIFASVTTLAAAALLPLAYLHVMTGLKLSALPDYLVADSIPFDETDAVGFGPGANEAGIVVYKQSEMTVRALRDGGLSFLNIERNRHDERGRAIRDYRWRATPGKFCTIIDKAEDYVGEPCEDDARAFAGSFLPSFSPPADVVKIANDAMKRPGNFFTYTGRSFFIVDTRSNYIIFIYAG